MPSRETIIILQTQTQVTENYTYEKREALIDPRRDQLEETPIDM